MAVCPAGRERNFEGSPSRVACRNLLQKSDIYNFFGQKVEFISILGQNIWIYPQLRERKFGMEKPIDFWLRTGKAGGEPKPTETIYEARQMSEVTTFF